MQPHSSELGQKMTSEGAGDDKPEGRGAWRWTQHP